MLAGALVLLALVQGAIGVHQYLTATGASYMGREVRAVGTFGPLDVMGMATAVGYGLTAALALGLAPGPRAPRWQRPAALTCAAVLTVPLALSFSRGAWIATAVAGAAVLLAAGARVAVPVLAVLALAVLAAAAVVLAGGTGTGSGLLGERVASIVAVPDAPDRSVTDRYALWAAAAGIWRDQPLTGAGLKEFPAERDGHASLGLSSGGDSAGAGVAFRREPLLSPHNMYLLALSEQGLIGATALVGGWAVLLVGGVRRLRAARRGRRATDCGLAATGLLVWQAVDFLSADIGGPSTVLTAVALGLVGWWALAPGRWPVPGGGTAAR
ncbi:O-antigen ligase family protein [Streptomyces endophytica]|uniref:O-antigen ligase family protein n=1 Tax=Streptomyces endophytica TaxID=2991496 RepID=UPI003C6F027A